jgi:hypothetical protein
MITLGNITMSRNDNDKQSVSETEEELFQQEDDHTRRFRDYQEQLHERREMKRFNKNHRKRGRFDDE